MSKKYFRFIQSALKVVTAFVCVTITLFSAFACAKQTDSSKYTVVCTIFPEYDWIRELTVGDDDFKIILLEKSGADMHNYQPSVADIAEISACDLFVYVGGESDSWTDRVLTAANNNKMLKVNLLHELGDLAQEEEHLDHEHEEDHEEEHEYDEHVWLSVKNAILFCDKLCDALCTINKDKTELYKSNALAYKQKLNRIDEAFINVRTNAKKDTLVFADRFPFAYLVRDYGINHYAAFSTCSTEINASFETIMNLAQKIDELDLDSICVLENATTDIAQSVKNNTAQKNQKFVTFNSMQSINEQNIADGTTYLNLMNENVTALKSALGTLGGEIND